MALITFEDIVAAKSRIAPYIRATPYIPFDVLNLRRKTETYLKCEFLQKTGSFKIRGAANCILENLSQAKKTGVICASAGNHAQGVAAIAHYLGIKATVVMPENSPGIKIQNTQRWGAEVVLKGEIFDESFEHASHLSKEKGFLFIHPFRDPKIMAGQGTLGLELLEEPSFKDIEAVVVSIGGGGLITGVATALKAKMPKIKIYGVTAKNAPSAYLTVKNKKATDHAVTFTLADGVATKRTDDYMMSAMTGLVDDVYSLSEDSIAHAISLLAEHSKMVVEGAGALPVAALLEDLIPEKKVALVLSGGNIDLPALGHVLQRGLVEQGRLVRLMIHILDRPGGLNSLTGILAEKKANILQVFHQRTSLNAAMGETEVEIDIETRGHEHTKDIIDSLVKKGFRVTRAT